MFGDIFKGVLAGIFVVYGINGVYHAGQTITEVNSLPQIKFECQLRESYLEKIESVKTSDFIDGQLRQALINVFQREVKSIDNDIEKLNELEQKYRLNLRRIINPFAL